MSKRSQLLQVENLCIKRGGVQVLDIPEFSVSREEKVAVIAPNGGGKSSLLLALACLIPRESGAITFNGAAVTPPGETASSQNSITRRSCGTRRPGDSSANSGNWNPPRSLSD